MFLKYFLLIITIYKFILFYLWYCKKKFKYDYHRNVQRNTEVLVTNHFITLIDSLMLILQIVYLIIKVKLMYDCFSLNVNIKQ